MFIGRKKTISYIKDRLLKSPHQGPLLAVCYGRRRIGKSELIRQIGKSYPNYFEIQGIAPNKGITPQHQINNLASEFCRQMNLPKYQFDNWRDLFILISKEVGKKKHCCS